MPQGINQAITAIWITIGLSLIAALINKWNGDASMGGFILYIVVYSIYCIFPYKLAKGSNPTRWVYAILSAATILLMLGGATNEMPIADIVVSIIMTPLEVFIIFRLFQSKSAIWFTQQPSASQQL